MHVFADDSSVIGASNQVKILNTEMKQDVTISDIDSLMDQRVEAIIKKDDKALKKINEEIEKRGVKEVSLQEVADLTGSVPTQLEKSQSTDVSRAAAQSSAKIETVTGTYTTGGKSYDVMWVYATPTGTTGTLYQTGVTTLNNTASAGANTMAFIKIGVSSVAGLASDTIGITQTVYGALSGVVSQLSKTTTITNIKASYTWNAAETCVFVYFKSPVTNGWMLKGQYSKASTGVGVSIPTLVINGSTVIASVKQKSYSGSASPVNYNSTQQKLFELIPKVDITAPE